MKPSLLCAAGFIFIFTSCKHENTPQPAPVDTVEQLPAYTETGANTFGCLVDGKVFVPRNKAGSSSVALQCYYQYDAGTYVLGVSAGDYKNDNGFKIAIGGNSVNDFVQQGTTINLTVPNTNSSAAGIWGGSNDNNGQASSYKTNDSVTGYITINKLDYNQQIISGVFAFDALDTFSHKIIHITDGRFDVHFTR